MDLHNTLDILRDKYEDYFKRIELDNRLTDNTNYAVLQLVDSHSKKSTYLFRLSEQTTESDISEWTEKVIGYYLDVRKLNNLLRDSMTDFRIKYKVESFEDMQEFSILSKWDYRSVEVALSIPSLELLHKELDYDSEFCNNAHYDGLGDFIKRYLTEDSVVNALEIRFKGDNIYDIMADHQLDKRTAIEKIKNIENKSGVVTLSSVIVSNSLQILCKTNWIVDFDEMDINVTFEENCLFSTKDNKFIRDKEILDGLLKLYKPNLNDIFEEEE
jgi:hypothetical protein